MQITGIKMMDNTLQLKINNPSISNQNLNVYDNFGKLVKTIDTKNSLSINKDKFQLGIWKLLYLFASN